MLKIVTLVAQHEKTSLKQKKSDRAIRYPVEFLYSVNPPGPPSHSLLLKVGIPVMLLRSLNPPKFCNGTNLRVTTVDKYVAEASMFSGCAVEESVSYREYHSCFLILPLNSSD